jgi:cell wall-associated NlpC family hydrolase
MMPVAPSWLARYSGIPFQDRGRTLKGCDCWGLVRMVFAERYQIELPDYTGYRGTSSQDNAEMAELVRQGIATGDWKKIEAGAEREGDCILLRMDGLPVHIALVVAPGLMLHTLKNEYSKPEYYRDTFRWSRRIQGFYRHKLRA